MSPESPKHSFSLSDFNELVSTALGSDSPCTYLQHYGSKSTSALDPDLSSGPSNWSDDHLHPTPCKAESSLPPRPQGFLRKAIRRASFVLSRCKEHSKPTSGNGRTGFTLKSMSLPASPLATSSPATPRFTFNVPTLTFKWPLGTPTSPKSPSTTTSDTTPPPTPRTPSSSLQLDPFSSPSPSPSFFSCSRPTEDAPVPFLRTEADPFAKADVQVLGRSTQTIKLREPRPRVHILPSSLFSPTESTKYPQLPAKNEELDLLATELGLDELLEQWPLPPPSLPFAHALARKESDCLLGAHASDFPTPPAPPLHPHPDRGRSRTRGLQPSNLSKCIKPSLPHRRSGSWAGESQLPNNFYSLPSREGSITPTLALRARAETQRKLSTRPSTPFPLSHNAPYLVSNTASAWFATPSASSATLAELESDRMQWNNDSMGNTSLPPSFLSFVSRSVDSFDRY